LPLDSLKHSYVHIKGNNIGDSPAGFGGEFILNNNLWSFENGLQTITTSEKQYFTSKPNGPDVVDSVASIKIPYQYPTDNEGGAFIMNKGAIWGERENRPGDMWFTLKIVSNLLPKFGGTGQPSGKCVVWYSECGWKGNWVEICEPYSQVVFSMKSVWIP
jgi:hypothetical protein